MKIAQSGAFSIMGSSRRGAVREEGRLSLRKGEGWVRVALPGGEPLTSVLSPSQGERRDIEAHKEIKSISKLENDFAATLATRRMHNGRLRFAQRISFVHFRL